MDDRLKAAFAFAQETTKQLIGLATGVIALTVTFSKDIATSVGTPARIFLMLSWIAFLLSVLCGVWTMLALTGTLEPKHGSTNTPTIRGRNVTIPSIAQIFFFLAGLVFAVFYAGLSL